MLNGGVAGGGDNGAEQRYLAERMSGSVAAFAYTGDPMRSDGLVLRDWPNAYQGAEEAALARDHPEEMTVHVMGGPHGSEPTFVGVGDRGKSSERDVALEQEKILERCRFINSIHEEIGV